MPVQIARHLLVGLAWAGLLFLLSGATICILNAITLPRLSKLPISYDSTGWDTISILVPARDEAEVIAACLRHLLAQQYPGELEVLILDDGSTDGTGSIARRIIDTDLRARVIDGQPLPPGWVGKNWACAQLAAEARGQVLVFTDADVLWEPGALAALVCLMQHHAADCLSAMPTQRTVSWSERLTVPMIAFLLLSFLPELGIRYVKMRAFSTANGQCLAFRRAAYKRIGGHASVKFSVIEDLSLARRVKLCGLKLVIAHAGPLISTRMYGGWRSVRYGFAKNILALHGGRPALLVVSMSLLVAYFVAPFVWLALGWLLPSISGWPGLPGALVALALGMRLLSAAVTGTRLRDAIFLPVTVILVLLVAAQSLWWHYRQGGPEWKGRRIATNNR